MDTFMLLLALAIFSITIGYYISILFSIQYKKVKKNKDNIKLSFKSKSALIYMPVFFLILSTLIFSCYFFLKGNTILISIIMIALTILVAIFINLSSTNFYIFNDHLIIKNTYIDFKEINTVTFKKTKKDDEFELQVITKYDLVSFPLTTNDSKSTFKSIKSLLPKNIKIKEA